MIDYEILRIIWWLLVGVLLIGLAITDGFDLGVGALLTLVGKDDDERRIMINTIGPHWDGNQVWLITAGGAIFAAWPMIYAAAFSGFYLALALTLIALWMRPLGFDYRSKLQSKKWRTTWDWALFVSGIVPALIFGVAFGNLILGVPFTLNEFLKPSFQGNLFTLLTPFALLAGLVSVAMLLTHGAVWLSLKTDSELQARSQKVASMMAIATVVLFALAGVWVSQLDGFVITSMVDTAATSNPLTKTVEVQAGAWLNNYSAYPWMIAAPVLAMVSGLACAWLMKIGRAGWGFVASALQLAGIILTAGFSMFPFLMPSTLNPAASLTVWDATSSQLTLQIMFVVACVFVPIVLGYTAWGFWVMRGRIKKEQLGQAHTIY